MKTTFGIFRAAAVLFVVTAAPASAQNNFVANGNFDTDVSGWIISASNEVTVAFDGAVGNTSPGSIRITNISPGASNGAGVVQCLGPVTAGKLYNWGGRVFFPGGQNRTGNLQIGLRWHPGPGCTGVPIDQPRLQTNSFDAWDLKAANNQPAPAGSVSVSFVAFPSKVEAGGALLGYFDSLFFRQSDGLIPPCVADAITLCLNNNRFSVTATWRTAQGAGAGTAVPLTTDTGSFWFFSSNNLEGIFKLVNGCAFNSFYWFFGGGLTNVEVILRVFDRQTGTAKVYVNPFNTAFLPVQDTAGFPCP